MRTESAARISMMKNIRNHAACIRGSSICTLRPPSARFHSLRSPPCTRAKLRAMASPKPIPPVAGLREGSRRWKGSSMRACSRSGMPGPDRTAPMPPCETACSGDPQADTSGGRTAGGFQTLERLQHACLLPLGDARAMVADRDGEYGGVILHGNPDFTACVLAGVFNQVGECALEHQRARRIRREGVAVDRYAHTAQLGGIRHQSFDEGIDVHVAYRLTFAAVP